MRYCLFILFILIAGAAAAPGHAQAAERYWVGGSGNWSDDDNHWATTSGGAPANGNVPTAADNAHFDANSNTTAYTVTIDATADMLDLKFDAAPSVSGTITWAGSAAMSIYGSRTLLSGMTKTYSGTITFRATSTGKLLTQNGVLDSAAITFDGVGGGWTLQDAFSPGAGAGVVTLTNGALDTNDVTVTLRRFVSTGSGTRSLDLGASAVSVAYNSTQAWYVTSSLSLTAGTSHITLSGNGMTFEGGGLTYNHVTFTMSGSHADHAIKDANTFNNLSLNWTSVGNSSIPFTLYANQTVTGTFTISNTAASAAARVLLASDTVGTPRTITAGAVSLTDVDFQDITAPVIPLAITFVDEAHADSGSTLTYPAGAQTGDLLVLVTQEGLSPETPSGWTQQFIYNTWGYGYTSKVYTKIKAADTSVTAPGVNGTATLLVYRNALSIGAVGTVAENNTATITAPSITTTSATSVVVACSQDRDPSTPSTPTGFTSRAGYTATYFGIKCADKSFGSIGATGGVDFTQSTATYNAIAWMFEVTPATGPWTGTRLGDAAGNSGITFVSTDKYYVGNTANWNGTVWALTSGGAAAANNFPLPQDRAILDAGSFSSNGQTLTINGAYRLPSIVATSTDQTYTLATSSNAPTLYGTAYTLDANVTISGTGTLTFSGRNTQTITSSGETWTQPLTINSIGGTVTLADNLTTGSGITTTLTAGTLNLNGKTLSTGVFSTTNSNTRAITSGGGGITTAAAGYLWNSDTPTNLTLNDALTVTSTYSGASTINISAKGTEAQMPSFNITAGTGTFAIESSSGVKNLNLTGFAGTLSNGTRTVYGNLTLPSGVVYSAGAAITTLGATSGTQVLTTNAAGTLDFPITINAPGATVQLADNLTIGSARTLTLTAGTLDLNGKTLSAGTFSSNNSNTRAITAGGGTFSFTAGGTVWDTQTITNLTLNDTVAAAIAISDGTTRALYGNSGLRVNFTVSGAGAGRLNIFGGVGSLDFTTASCDWFGDAVATINGSLTYSPNMTAAGASTITLAPPSGSTAVLTTNGKVLNSPYVINGAGGTLQLGDNVTLASTVSTTLTAGTLDLNGKTLSTGIFAPTGSTARTIKSSVAGGKVTTTSTSGTTVWSSATVTNLTVTRSPAWTIEIGGNSTNARIFAGGGATWPALTFTNTTSAGEIDFTGSNTFKSISVSTPPQTLKFTTGTNTTIEDTTTGFPSGTSGSLVTVSTISGTATLTKSGGGRVCSDYLALSNITGSPSTLAWYVGANSTGSGTGLVFTACPEVPATNPVVPHASAGMLTATGGTVSTVVEKGVTYRVHTFTTVGTTTFRVTGGSGNVQYLVVGGGGGGGGMAGGGAGGYRTNSAYNYPVSGGSYTVTVGSGGAGSSDGATKGSNGSNSVFDTITSIGGGGGGGWGDSVKDGLSGGSGGGAGTDTGNPYASGTGGAGTAGQGNMGGSAVATGATAFGGGGGAGAVGATATAGVGGAGGAGVASTISGASVTYAGGGGGGANATPGSGGSGGGGHGALQGGTQITAGTANTGGGGGGGYNSAGAAGGSGIVIIRYPINMASLKNDDLYWNNVVLLAVNNNKADATTAFVDQSKSPKILTAAGHAQWDTAQAPTGMTSSALFDGTGDQISTPHNNDFNLGTGQFTVELWIKFNSIASHSVVLTHGNLGAGTGAWALFMNAGLGQIMWYIGNGGGGSAGEATVTTGTWYHYAVTRDSSNTVRGYLNGVHVGTPLTNHTFDYTVDSALSIGDRPSAGYGTNGWISGVRVTKGVARYTGTGSFTPPGLPLSSPSTPTTKINASQNSKVTSGLVGLWSFDGADLAGANGGVLTAYDRSGQANHATSTGGVTKTIGKIGQALRLNGTGYMASSFSGSQIPSSGTVSVWLKPGRAWNSATREFPWGASVGGTTDFEFQKYSDDNLYVGFIGPGADNRVVISATASNWDNSTWHNWVLTWVSGGSSLLYHNGVRVGSFSPTTIQNPAAPFWIGATSASVFAGNYFSGALDDMRFYNRALTPAEIKLLYTSGK